MPSIRPVAAIRALVVGAIVVVSGLGALASGADPVVPDACEGVCPPEAEGVRDALLSALRHAAAAIDEAQAALPSGDAATARLLEESAAAVEAAKAAAAGAATDPRATSLREIGTAYARVVDARLAIQSPADDPHGTIDKLLDAVGEALKDASTLLLSPTTRETAKDALLAAPVVVWTSLNMGTGTGLDADLLDGLSSEAFFLAIEEEAKARKAADDALRADLDAEIDARRVADDALRADLDAEIDARQAAVEALSDDLKAEIDARKLAIADLQAGLDRLGDDLNMEIDARRAAVETLTNDLNAEIDARKAAVDALAADLDEETRARIAADDALAGDLGAEIDARKAAVEAVRDDLNAEIDARKAAVEKVAADLDEETKARIAQDEALQATLDAEIDARKLAVDALAADLGAETDARKAAIAGLVADLDAEIAAREAALDALRADLDAEIAAREADVAGLETRIDGVEAAIPGRAWDAVLARDGLGSALDADFLDGLSSDAFLRADVDVDADLLDGLDSTAFLLVDGKAADANLLDGLDSSDFLRAHGKAVDADLLDGLDSKAFSLATHNHDALYLGITAKAADADKLDGFDASDFLTDTGKALDAELLDGLDSSAFLAASAKAADADKLDGLDSTAFLKVDGKAADANLLDGLDSSSFLLVDGKAADANFLDGLDSSSFLGATATAVNADKLDNLDSTAFSLVGHTHDASAITSGTITDARLSGNVAFLSGSQTFTGLKTFSVAPSFSATATAPFSVSSSTKVVNLHADLLDGLEAAAFALAAHNHDSVYLGINAKAVDADKLDNLDSSAFSLVGHVHDATAITTGTLADARLSGNVAFLSGSQTFTGVKTFSVAPSFSATATAPFSVSSSTKVVNLHADLLDGLEAAAFALAAHNHDSVYLGINAKAVDADKLDNLDSTAFLRSDTSGTLSGALTVTGAVTIHGGLDMRSMRIQNLAAPTLGTDAATKTYVDNAVSNGGGGVPSSGVVLSETKTNANLQAAGYAYSGVPIMRELEDITNKGFTTGSPSNNPTWAGVAYARGKYYVFGGLNGGTVQATFSSYDPATGAWTSHGNMPAGAWYGMCAIATKNSVYLLGGKDSASSWVDRFWRYNAQTNTWTNIKAASGLTLTRTTGSCGEAIYDEQGGHDLAYFADAYRLAYFFPHDTASPMVVYNIASLNPSRWGVLAKVVENKLYVIGGSLNADENGQPTNIVEEWTITGTGSLSQTNCGGTCAPLPQAMYFHGGFDYAGRIYVGGGTNAQSQLVSGTLEFNPIKNTWSTVSNQGWGQANVKTSMSSNVGLANPPQLVSAHANAPAILGRAPGVYIGYVPPLFYYLFEKS